MILSESPKARTLCASAPDYGILILHSTCDLQIY
jgi:hypothetical protein